MFVRFVPEADDLDRLDPRLDDQARRRELERRVAVLDLGDERLARGVELGARLGQRLVALVAPDADLRVADRHRRELGALARHDAPVRRRAERHALGEERRVAKRLRRRDEPRLGHRRAVVAAARDERGGGEGKQGASHAPILATSAPEDPVTGARVRPEVHVLQPVGGEMRVDLGRRDVGVAEHLLQRAQVAAAGQQMGGERVAQGVRAHAPGEAGARRVALDDLVAGPGA